MDLLSPFKVTITIQNASNLAIADILSSDPYVMVYFNDKIIGKTKTVYANHLNPVWDEVFESTLLHTQYTLKLKIFDEDQGKHDDFMGMVQLDLQSLAVNQLLEMSQPLMDVDNEVETKGVIKFAVFVHKQDKAIKLTELPSPVDLAAHPEIVALIKGELQLEGIEDSDPVQDAILQSPIVANETTVLSRFMVRDLLHDVFQFNSDCRCEAMYSGRTQSASSMVSSTTIDISSRECRSSPPVGMHMVALECFDSAWDELPSSVHELVFPGRFLAWHWLIYLRCAVDYWRGITTDSELPDYIVDNRHIIQTTTPLTIVTGDDQVHTGCLVLNFKEKFMITCENAETRDVILRLDVSNLRNVRLSADSPTSSKYYLLIKNISLRLKKPPKQGINSYESQLSLSSHASAESDEPIENPNKTHRLRNFPVLRAMNKGIKRVSRSVLGTATAAATAASDVVADTAVDAAKVVTSSAATAVRTIAAVDAAGAISAVKTVTQVGVSVGATVLGAGSTVVTSVSNLHNGTFLQPMVHLLIRAGKKVVCLESKPVADEVEWKDLSLDFDVEESDLEANDGRGLELTVFRGQQRDMESPVAVKLLPFSVISKRLIKNPEGPVSCKVSNMLGTCSTDPISVPYAKFLLQINLGLRVSLICAAGVPDNPLFKQSSYCMYVTCKCVKWNGDSRRIVTSLKSKIIPACCDPEWIDEDFVLLDEHGIQWARYVRVELLHGYVLSAQKQKLGATSVGVIYIPFEDFTNTSKTLTFPMVEKRSGRRTSSSLTVAFRRIQDEIDDPLRVNLDCALDQDDTVAWNSHAILSGAVEEAHLSYEEFAVCPSFHGIVLSQLLKTHSAVVNTNDAGPNLSNTDQAHNSDKGDFQDHDRMTTADLMRPTDYELSPVPHLSVDSRTVSVHEDKLECFEVFENERRGVLPPHRFGPGNLFLHAHFTDASGNVPIHCTSVNEIKSPFGCIWVGEWQVDKDHTQTDEDGWSYAISYDFLVSNCKNNCSSASSLGRASRRRRHIRFFRPSDDAVILATSSRNELQNGPEQQPMGISSKADASFPRLAAITEIFSRNTIVDSAKLTRIDLFNSNPGKTVVQTCKERSSVDDDTAIIPWSQVTFVEEVTSSTLLVRVRLHRYFGINGSGEDIFHLADVDIFLFNCPSRVLKSLVIERIAVYSIRRDMVSVIGAGNLTGGIGNTEAEDGIDCDIPATQELSLGSHIAAQIDTELIALGDEIERAKLSGNTTNLASLQFRECRLRLYVASLLRANVKGSHEFSDAEIDDLMIRDFETAKKIIHDSEVATVNNRIEYLLDMAEMHLRDGALCGWQHRKDGKLSNFIERIVNGYLLEMVSLLGKFFDDNKVIRQVKGLSSKTQLILTFMRHNDRLGQLLESALRPYNMVASPRPKLQLFLRLDTLVGWYSTALEQEMFSKVDNVLKVWKDPSKDASGEASRYRFPLPWIPMRERRETGLFISQIPEDVRETLMNYLLYARFNESECASNFQEVIEKFDERIGVIYVKSFMYLADLYSEAIDSINWALEPGTAGEDEIISCMEERLEYLCSVANDLRRIDQSNLLVLQGDLKRISRCEAIANINATASSKLMTVLNKVTDCIGNVLMRIMATEQLWINPNSHIEWLGRNKATSTAEAEEDSKSFAAQMVDLEDLLGARVSYLDSFCGYKVLLASILKVVGRYLFMLRCAQEANRHILLSSPEVVTMLTDIQAVKDCFNNLMKDPELSTYADAVLSQAKYLDHALAIITFDKESEEFNNTLQSMLKIAQGHPECAMAFAKFVECCLYLRHDSEPARAAKDLKRRGSVISMLGIPGTTDAHRGTASGPITGFDKKSLEVLEMIQDCYEPVDSVDISFNSPVGLVFSTGSKFSVVNFLFGYKSLDTAAISRRQSILGSVLSIMSSGSSPRNPGVISDENPSRLLISQNAGPLDRIIISNITCRNLLCISGKPKAFLLFTVDGINAKTVVKDGTTATWTDELEFSVHSVSSRQSGLTCTLSYLGKIYGDEPVASVSIPLTALSICDMENETFHFDAWKSPKAKAAADKAILLGSDLPSITLSIRVVK